MRNLYRVNDPSELEEIEKKPVAVARGHGALIEWPERAPDALPATVSTLRYHRPALGSSARAAEINRPWQGGRASRKAQDVAAVSRCAGYADARRPAHAGDASTRSYGGWSVMMAFVS